MHRKCVNIYYPFINNKMLYLLLMVMFYIFKQMIDIHLNINKVLIMDQLLQL